MRLGQVRVQGRPNDNLIGVLQSCSCSQRMVTSVHFTSHISQLLTVHSFQGGEFAVVFSCSHSPTADSLSTRWGRYPWCDQVGMGLE